MYLVQTMAYVGAKPWHALGSKLEPQQPIKVWRRQAGMGWEIEGSEARQYLDRWLTCGAAVATDG